MPLAIATFDNRTGPSAFFKAIGHPLAAERIRGLLDELRASPLAVYDPRGHAGDLFALFPAEGWRPAAYFVQRLEDLGRDLAGIPARPVGAIGATEAAALLVAAFDAGRFVRHLEPLLPAGCAVRTLDEARIPERLLSNPSRYLDPLNFATNHALFRDRDGLWTRLTTVNYWAGYGAAAPRLVLRLYDGEGRELAGWEEELGSGARAIVIDSRRVRRRFGLPPFAGTLFLHAVGIAGHDTIKYALDIGDSEGRIVSSTHDANAFPADLYAGLPAPEPGQRVLLWLQNAHPTAVPAGAIALARMGSEETRPVAVAIPPFGTAAVDVADVLPRMLWPAQIEVHASRHVVRPRYEVVTRTSRAIAHANVERSDIVPEPVPPAVLAAFGKGPLVVAPLPPPERWRTHVLPTPMARHRTPQALVVRARDPEGREIACRSLGALPRDHAVALDLGDVIAPGDRPAYGHLEIAYDPADPDTPRDGWLHALVRFRARDHDAVADTSFGAHVFNLPVTWRGEPQSYAGEPPGLSTRLFLRLAEDVGETVCHLIYPASGAWRPRSATAIVLHDADGREVARRDLAIPLDGSRRFLVGETFDGTERAAARGGYVIVRDLTCRLFGYHGLLGRGGGASLDHMFGF